MRRAGTAEHQQFASTVRAFTARHITPHLATWIADGVTPTSLWQHAGDAGLLGISVFEAYGGGGSEDFGFNAVLVEELCRAGTLGLASSIGIHANIVSHYLVELTEPNQQQRWLPDFASGRSIAALAMTEPGAGSDLRALRMTARAVDGGFLLSGQKTFITNGSNASLIVVAAKTDPERGHRGISLFLVDGNSAGLTRGRRLKKIGQHESDTAELFFDDVFVPQEDLLGEQDRGYYHLLSGLPQERLSVSVMAIASAQVVLEETVSYLKDRAAYGGRLADLQHVRMVIATLSSEVDIGWTFVERCIEEHNEGRLSATDAAKVKWWTTELQRRTTDECLQLHGGYGYMSESNVSRAWLDGRVQSIYAGSTETLKDYIGRQLVG